MIKLILYLFNGDALNRISKLDIARNRASKKVSPVFFFDKTTISKQPAKTARSLHQAWAEEHLATWKLDQTLLEQINNQTRLSDFHRISQNVQTSVTNATPQSLEIMPKGAFGSAPSGPLSPSGSGWDDGVRRKSSGKALSYLKNESDDIFEWKKKWFSYECMDT